MTANDLELLGKFTRDQSQDAFTALVQRHLDLVYCAALRQVRSPQLAEDVAQSVFIDLARNAVRLKPDTVLTAWLYQVTRRTAVDVVRSEVRRQLRERIASEMNAMNANAADWIQVEPLLDEAMQALDETDRTAVLLRYFENKSLREVGQTLGTTDDAARKRVSRAIERLREFFAKRGVTVCANALVIVISANAVQAAPIGLSATIAAATAAALLSSASVLVGTSAVGSSLLMTLMKATTTTKIIAAAAALLIAFVAVQHLTRKDVETTQLKSGNRPAPLAATVNGSPYTPDIAKIPAAVSPRAPFQTALLGGTIAPAYDEAALETARGKQWEWENFMHQMALIGDLAKVQELLASKYGIHLSIEEIRTLQEKGNTEFEFSIIKLWAAKQPQEALTWAASALSEPNYKWDFQGLFLDAARTTLPDLNRDTLAGMLPEGPGKAKLLDLVEAATDPYSLANRILAMTDPAQRASRLKVLGLAWSNAEPAVEWARQNLSGTDKAVFYLQVGAHLADQNPPAALRVLGELRGTDAYTQTFAMMMRGLVEEGGQGQQAAELIANSDLHARQRAELISELAGRWVRNDPDAAIAWANNLTAPEDFRAAIPLLVSQLDNDRVSRTVETYLKNGDPVMERALIEAAAPPGLAFDPAKSRLILDPLISRDPELKLKSSESNDSKKEALLWRSVNQTAARLAEVGPPGGAMEWLTTLPFASQNDYAHALANALNVWNIKSPTEAAGWVQNSALNPTLKAELLKTLQP